MGTWVVVMEGGAGLEVGLTSPTSVKGGVVRFSIIEWQGQTKEATGLRISTSRARVRTTSLFQYGSLPGHESRSRMEMKESRNDEQEALNQRDKLVMGGDQNASQK
jgi:hypothetical protein